MGELETNQSGANDHNEEQNPGQCREKQLVEGGGLFDLDRRS